jgi:hypothetical protein
MANNLLSEVFGIDEVIQDIQIELYDKIIALQPKRVIFNPGTENPEFETLLASKGIETEIACTLVLLSIDNY